MKTVEVEVTWYESVGDGDNYTDEVEISDDNYLVLRKYFRNNYCDKIRSDEIEDEEVKSIVAEIENQSLNYFIENSRDGYKDYLEDMEDSEEEIEEFEEWMERFEKSAKLIWEKPKKCSFTINISNGGESKMSFNVYKDELKLLDQADDEFEDYENVEGLEDFYEELMEAARAKLEEDLDLTGDDPSILEELEWSITR